MSADADLARFKAQLENVWRIADELGDPTPEHMKVFELVRLEMGFRAKIEVAMNLASLASQWITTRNPFCIDRAVVTCFVAGVEPSPSLQFLIAEVANRRLIGEISSGTPEKLANEAAKQATLLFIANLIHSGETLDAACSKGAAVHARDFPDLKRLKASMLDKYYVAEWRSQGADGLTREDRTFAGWDKYKDDATREEWARIAQEAPTADECLRGERR